MGPQFCQMEEQTKHCYKNLAKILGIKNYQKMGLLQQYIKPETVLPGSHCDNPNT